MQPTYRVVDAVGEALVEADSLEGLKRRLGAGGPGRYAVVAVVGDGASGGTATRWGSLRKLEDGTFLEEPGLEASEVMPALLLGGADPNEPTAVKGGYKALYDRVSTQLNETVFGAGAYFLNWGYLPDGSPEHAVVQLPRNIINKNGVKLVLELIGDCPVDGKRILDVGCGRGGTIWTLKEFFRPATLTGLDMSSAAIAFDREAHGDERTTFVEGDAENLPFPDGSFDVVTNVESSHSYPDLHRFFEEVHRVLAPAGCFLYTDVLGVGQVAAALAYLGRLGFDLERNTDISKNVLLSSDESARQRLRAYGGRNDPEFMGNLLATPGSGAYEEIRSGRWEYRILRLRKR
jgi:phthiocerol/phenolphthiocerol synthesis type-I polyketide synthase E